MIRRGLIVLGAALCLGGTASAVKLPVKTIDMITGEIIEDVSQGMTKAGGGQTIRKVITKVPGKIPWGGVMSIGGVLLQAALQKFYDEAQKSIHPDLDAWWNGQGGNYPSPRDFRTPDGYTFVPDGFYCQGSNSSGVRFTYWLGRTTINGQNFYGTIQAYYLSNGSVHESLGGTGPDKEAVTANTKNNCAGLVKDNETLDSLLKRSPTVTQALQDILRDYVRNNPDASPVRDMFRDPAPTRNQFEDALVDPTIISVPNSRYSDGDYLQEGEQPTPGNRPHPLDGPALEPWADSPTPKDTDGDGIPDWRDSDDDADGVPDDAEEPDGQKDPSKKPPTHTDTDGDGIPDSDDSDDDGDGWSDADEESNGSDPKSPTSKPTDNDGDGISDKDDPDDDNDGATDAEEEAAGTDKDDPQDKPEEEPCQPGQTRGEDGTCAPEEEEDKCQEGYIKNEDTGKCEPDPNKGKEPVADNCGDLSIPRLLAHTKNYLRDVVFPCKDIGDVFKPLMDKAATKYPFAMVSAFQNGVVQTPSSGDQSATLPAKLGPFDLDWSWLTPLITVVGLLFKGATSWLAVDLVLSRLMGQVVVK